MMSSLIGHEDRLGKKTKKSEEKAFQMKGEYSGQKYIGGFGSGRGRGRSGGHADHGRGRGRGSSDNSSSSNLSYNRAQNLLSVGQMVENNCSVLFEGNVCVIKDNISGLTLAVLRKMSNNLYPLEMSSFEASALIAKSLAHLNPAVVVGQTVVKEEANLISSDP
ncbi:unnamed protein product [Arabis nemorensis]|uniref:Uncharacterized protein n=1 Tax=Arabis nemorensis TaxID=586526 RepID=A0A565CFJ0_9BRAS|nr:unnamed protein product [Arabis nemorensis]